MFQLAQEVAALQDTFLHGSGTGPTHVFFARLSVTGTRSVADGAAWRHEFPLTASTATAARR